MQTARDEHDYVGDQFLGWFLEEQREEVASMSALLSIVDRAGTTQPAARRGLSRPHDRNGRRAVETGAAGGRRRALGLAANPVGDDPDLPAGIVGGWYSVENDIVLAPVTGGPPPRDPGRTA